MKILVGLGNPGHTFSETRHNAGFVVIQRLAERHQGVLNQRVISRGDARPAAVYGDYADAGQTVRLMMPLTMMNESGEALTAMAPPPQDLLIICDDVNLPLGTIRLKPQGSAGGHHGLVSCLEALGTEAVARLRIGVGTAQLPRDLTGFVLSPVSSAERGAFNESIQQAVEACEVWVREGIEAAMNRYNAVQE